MYIEYVKHIAEKKKVGDEEKGPQVKAVGHTSFCFVAGQEPDCKGSYRELSVK